MLGETVGPYRLIAELGAGGMGSVYLAEATRSHAGIPSGARVAVKVVHPRLLESPGVVRRFLREAEIGKNVRHPNVVRTLDVGSEESANGDVVHYLAMELVRGQTLRALVAEEGVLTEELCRHLGREVGAALDAIHDAGVVHRDLKPENILITFDESVKVMDLGVAHLQDEATRLTRTGAFIGSFQYAAPEQLSEGGTAIDGRADLFALGVTLFEAVTGRHPHGKGDFGTTLRRVLFEDPPRASSLHTAISPFFEEVIHRLLARDKDARFPTAREVVDILTEGEQCTWWRCRAQAIQQQEHRPLRRIRMPRETDLFGRDAELNRLRDQFDRVRDGRGCVLLMEGEAGIGKTRLIDEFVSRLESEEDAGEFHFLHGSYPPIGAAAAAGAFSTAYREHLGSAALEDALKVHLDGDTSMVPAFAALLRGDSLPRGGDPLTRDALSSLFVRIT
ncbi:MAG: serine/threonine-protein kinase, partial [Planctomycetota bacterium]